MGGPYDVYLVGPVADAVIAVGIAYVLRGPAKAEEAGAAQGEPLYRSASPDKEQPAEEDPSGAPNGGQSRGHLHGRLESPPEPGGSLLRLQLACR